MTARTTIPLLLSLLVIISLPAAQVPKPQSSDEIIKRYIDTLSRTIDPRARAVLPKIDGVSRRWLALRTYLVRSKELKAKWSWTPKEVTRYKNSPKHAQALAEVEKVKARFAMLNPGYSLHVVTDVRTLDEQIRSWNKMKSVVSAAAELMAATVKKLPKQIDSIPPEPITSDDMTSFLKKFKPRRVPSVSVPGMSEHGQLRAYDFAIKHGDTIVAGTDAATIKAVWDNSGWTAKLKTAVTQASSRFTGPLKAPYEPWHYSYKQ